MSSISSFVKALKLYRPSAWRNFAKRFVRPIARTSREFGVDPEEYGEVFATVFVVAVKQISAFRPPYNLGAWVAGITKRTIMKQFRDTKRRQKREANALDEYAARRGVRWESGHDEIDPHLKYAAVCVFVTSNHSDDDWDMLVTRWEDDGDVLKIALSTGQTWRYVDKRLKHLYKSVLNKFPDLRGGPLDELYLKDYIWRGRNGTQN